MRLGLHGRRGPWPCRSQQRMRPKRCKSRPCRWVWLPDFPMMHIAACPYALAVSALMGISPSILTPNGSLSLTSLYPMLSSIQASNISAQGYGFLGPARWLSFNIHCLLNFCRTSWLRQSRVYTLLSSLFRNGWSIISYIAHCFHTGQAG